MTQILNTFSPDVPHKRQQFPHPADEPSRRGDSVCRRAAARSHGLAQRTSSYPASSIASRTACGSRGASLVTVAVPEFRSTSTPVTPDSLLNSLVTALTQWPQVMPLISYVAAVMR